LSAAGGENKTVLVTWNRSSPALLASSGGLLTIADAGASKTINVNASELRTGSVIYHYNGPEVMFRLELTYPDGARFVQARTWHAGTAPAAAPPR
jgi:hypothetical protein